MSCRYSEVGMTRLLIRVGVIVAMALATVTAQQRSGPAPDQFGRLHWRTIGPEGNRFSAAAGVAGDPYTYYVGAASGGVWKTIDGGINWTPIFDAQPVSIDWRAGRRAASDPNVVWAGTGEALHPQPRFGWRGHLQVHRRRQDLDAASGSRRPAASAASSSTRRTRTSRWPARSATPTGRSRNAGCSAPPTAARPGSGRCSWTRTPAARTSRWTRTTRACSSPACGRSRSTRGAARAAGPAAGSSSPLTAATPGSSCTGAGCRPAPLGKVALGIAPSNTESRLRDDRDRRRRAVEGQPTDSGQLWRTDDGGDTWQLVSYDRNVMGRAHYYSRMVVAPDNENEAYFLTASYSQDHRWRRDDRRSSSDSKPRAATTTTSGSIRPTQPHDRRARPGALDHGQPRPRGTRSACRTRRSTTSLWTTRFPTTCYGNKQDGPSYRGPSNSRLQGGSAASRGIPRGDVALRSAAARAAGPLPTRPTRTSSGPLPPARAWSAASSPASRRTAAVPQRGGVARPVERPGGGLKYRFVWDAPLAHLAARSQHDLRRQPARAPDDQRRSELGGHQPGSDAQRQVASRAAPAASRRTTSASSTRASCSRIAESPKREGAHLGRHQRRPGAGHARRRQDLDERHRRTFPDLPPWGTVPNIEPSRYDDGDGLSDRRRPSGEQSRSVGLQDDRLRQDVEVDHQRHSEEHAQLRARHPRGSGAARLLYLGTENAHLRLVR